jgi:hypothetical protein
MSAALEEVEKEAAQVSNRMAFAPAERDAYSRCTAKKIFAPLGAKPD